MSTPPAKSFGRRTWTENPAPRSPRTADAPRGEEAGLQSSLSPDVIAAVLRGARPVSAATDRAAIVSVGWSLRAAILAGLIVGLFNAAARATTFLSLGGLAGADKLPLENTILNQLAPDPSVLGHATLGQATVPIAVLVALAGLWGGARASAFTLLIAHKLLAKLGQTSFVAYALGGAAASLAYALIAALVGADTTPLSVTIEALSGLGAGFFYRLFAATERG